MTRKDRKRAFYKAALARSDFLASLKACEVMIEHVKGYDHPLYYHLYTSAVIGYARPFVNSDLGVLPSQWSKFKQPWMRDIHKQVIKARHEVIAHNDAQARRMWIVPPGVAPADQLPASSNGIVLKIEAYYINGGFSSLARLCDFQIHRLNAEIDQQLQQLYEVASLPAEEFVLSLDESL